MLWRDIFPEVLSLGLENKRDNYGVMATNINGPVTYNTIEAKKRLHALMPRFIEILAENMIKDSPSGSNCIPTSYKIEDKIEHNKLSKYRYLVSEYGNYYFICENAFTSLDNIIPYSKERILRSISEKYKDEKRLLLSTVDQEITDMVLIRSNSDYIIDKIMTTIREEIMLNYYEENIMQEDLDYCIPVFLCYAFVECKILERP